VEILRPPLTPPSKGGNLPPAGEGLDEGKYYKEGSFDKIKTPLFHYTYMVLRLKYKEITQHSFLYVL